MPLLFLKGYQIIAQELVGPIDIGADLFSLEISGIISNSEKSKM